VFGLSASRSKGTGEETEAATKRVRFEMKILRLTPMILLVLTIAFCAAHAQEKEAGNGEPAPKLDEITLERI
jgi:hypothetical protein